MGRLTADGVVGICVPSPPVSARHDRFGAGVPDMRAAGALFANEPAGGSHEERGGEPLCTRPHPTNTRPPSEWSLTTEQDSRRQVPVTGPPRRSRTLPR